jgi:hypothetical protein
MAADWNKLTAIGTLALALVTFLALLATIGVAAWERSHTDKQIAAEREAADGRMQRQMDHSDAQLAGQQARHEKEIADERRRARSIASYRMRRNGLVAVWGLSAASMTYALWPAIMRLGKIMGRRLRTQDGHTNGSERHH